MKDDAKADVTVDPETFTIDYAGLRTFELGEPSAEVLLRIVNLFGALGRRAQAHVQKVMRTPTMAGLVWSLAEILTIPDLERLGSAVLQFEDDRDGRKWIRENGVKIAPIIGGLLATLRMSTDLVEALKALGEGLAALESTARTVDLSGVLGEISGAEVEASEIDAEA